jgi:diguanylate cyclase (GGDEF)-like protein/PAS domain S-box-containing protein
MAGEEARIMPEEGKTRVQVLEEQNRALRREEEALPNKLPLGPESENALRESEKVLAKAFQASPDWMTITTLNEGMFIKVNDAFTAISGYSREEVLGRTAFELGFWENTADRDEVMETIARTGTLRNYEVRLVMKSGAVRVFLWSAERIEVGSQKALLSVCRDITKRKSDEEALRLSEKRYRDLYNGLYDGFAVVNLEGKFVEFNPAFERMLGYDPEEIRELTYVQITPEKWQAREERILREQVAVRGYSDLYEKEYRRKDGALLPVELRTYLLRDEEGLPQGMWAFVRDVSETKKAEEALRENEIKFRTLFESAHDAICLIQGECFADCNTETLIMFNAGRMQIIGKKIWDVSPPLQPDGQPSRDKAQEKMRAALGGEPQFFEWRHQRINGAPFSAEVSLNRIMIGQEVYLQSIIRDITERKRMEAARLESERRYRLLFETAQEAILVMKGFIFIDCNPAAERLLGCNRHEILGSTPFRFSPEFQPGGERSEEKGTEMVGKVVRLGPQRFEWVHQALDGRRFDVEVSISQFYMEGQSHLFVLERDITEQKRAQEELRSLSLIDELTGLYNRRGFLTLARQQLKMASRMNRGMFLLFADLDGLKGINDHYGHPVGDQALKDVADIMRETFREPDIMARIGGDEFVVLAIEGASAANAEMLTFRFSNNFLDFRGRGKRLYPLSVSHGIVRYVPGGLLTIEELMAQADRLMYEKKRQKKAAS